uniref:Tudor domain-containing protein n=1 Tax=Romanomermis culicivorax TaxID=13658 RepID=A0A915KR86_ROMCU
MFVCLDGAKMSDVMFTHNFPLNSTAQSQATAMANYRLDCVDDEIALSYDNPPVSINDEMEGIVTFGDDWLNFHFQSISSTEILRDLQFNMNDLYNSIDFPSITQTPAFVTGAPCVARYSKDNKWYRAKLFDISYSVVYFVDYGNKQMTNLENVKPLTRTLAELVPPLALQCTLITDFQNPLLPSFVESSEIIKVTVHSKHEPYEVSVRVPSQPQTNDQSNLNYGSSVRQNGRRPAAVTSSSSYRPSNGAAGRAQTAQGLTLPSVRSSSKFASGDDTEDDIEQMKNQNRRTRLVNNGGKLSVTGAAGTVMQMHATCGQIAPTCGPYRVNVFEFNSQESTLDNGVLTVEDLSRIFKTGDKLICNARFEDPLPQGTLVNKISKPPQGYYQVTDIQLVPSSRILICHAIVVFVSNEGIGLYMRNRRESIFAPVSSFPEKKQDMLMSEFVELGRSVVVRCAPAEQFPDLQVTAEWVALAVEFLGKMVESQGWMYFIRENYSVIITEGGVGFGYLYMEGVRKLASEYGTRAIFRACIDVPDKQDFRFGTRWKALRVRLIPEHSKGPFRYPGIYRPTPMPFYDDAVLPAAKKTLDDEMEDNFELPEEALEEMRVMGQDQIGIDSLRSGASKPKAFLSEIADNLLNEQEELTLNVNEEDA